MTLRRAALRALLPFACHGLAREIDQGLGVALHTSLDLPGFVGEALSLVQPMAALGGVLAWTLAGGVAWTGLSAARKMWGGTTYREALAEEAGGFGPLYLRPVITALALLCLAWLPTFPYGSTLPVALTQDWGPGQDLAALAAILALRVRPLRLPVPSAGGVAFMAFLVYALLSPSWARQWSAHPGNQPKTLRTAVAIGHGLTLDAEGVSAPMEELTPRPLVAAARDAAAALAGESWRMLGALTRGPSGVGAEAIQASRITRQTIRGKDGGVYYVLPPGPSLLLAPALRVDRVLNRVLGTHGRLAVTLLLWNGLAAALVAAVFVLARDASGRPGIAAAVSGFFALAPPYVFYFHQFYPEMLGALVLALVLRHWLFSERWTASGLLVQGLLLAWLPWLHQKFLPVWLVLVVVLSVVAVNRLVELKALLALLVPQAVTLYLTALYNFAITGSVRPDALYLAWGPGGVSGSRIDEGLLGLMFDARYGLLPYAPLYILGIAALAMRGGMASRLRLALPVLLAYHLTVAAADNWSGAVCALGRYLMPITPLLVAGVAVALAASKGRRGVVALAVALAGWTALVGAMLVADPHAADDCARLLSQSVFADGNVYLPNLFFRSPLFEAPGHAVRVAAWIGLVLVLAVWLRRLGQGRGGRSPGRVLAATAALVLALGLLLEGWPSVYGAPRFASSFEIQSDTRVFLLEGARLEGQVLKAEGGEVRLLIRSRPSLDGLRLEIWGEGALRIPGRPRLYLRGRPVSVDLPLEPSASFTGRRGIGERLFDIRLDVETDSAVYLRIGPRS